MVIPAEYHEHELEAADGDRWLGVYLTDSCCVASRVVITIETVFDPVMDDEGEATGRVVAAPLEGVEPLFLLLPPEGSPVGAHALITAFCGPVVLDYGTALPLGAMGTLRADSAGLFLVAGTQSQRLTGVYPDSTGQSLELIWAGDIDGDGLVDLVLDDRSHYAFRFNFTLYLSTEAGPGELVHEAAWTASASC